MNLSASASHTHTHSAGSSETPGRWGQERSKGHGRAGPEFICFALLWLFFPRVGSLWRNQGSLPPASPGPRNKDWESDSEPQEVSVREGVAGNGVQGWWGAGRRRPWLSKRSRLIKLKDHTRIWVRTGSHLQGCASEQCSRCAGVSRLSPCLPSLSVLLCATQLQKRTERKSDGHQECLLRAGTGLQQ